MSLARRPAALVAASAAALVLGSCSQHHDSPKPASTQLPPVECGTYTARGCAPDSMRVDLAMPAFSNSAEITNPLFPISRLRSVVLLGHVEGKPFRTETTLLPGTSTVVWNGQKIRARISQYMAYLDGRLEEVALDRYAQADDGSVWYLGEDVFDYAHGAVAITEGTWLAGREGPAAMIMPGHPAVGDTYRTENVPGIVFEEVTVKSVDQTVTGPRGAVRGAILASELHADGTREEKLFAPGYGEFRTAGGGDLEALAMAVPADALPGPAPAPLDSLATNASGILEAARIGEWQSASAAVRRMIAGWAALRRGQPPMVAARLSDGLARLGRAVRARRAARVEQLALDVAQPVLDLELRYRPAGAVDAGRFELWTQQLRVHAAAKDLAAVAGDVAVLEWMRDRVVGAMPPAALEEVDSRLRALRTASDSRNLRAAGDHAARLGARMRNLVSGPP